MENQYQKIVTVSYLAFAALVAFISLTGMMKVADAYDLESKIKSIEYIIRIVSLALGGGVFIGLYRNPKISAFMNEVSNELLTKVSWPTSRETYTATGVVIVTVILAGMLLGFFDWIWSYALRLIV